MNLPVEGILTNLDSIINETLDSLLTRKADYTIILKYAVFLMESGRIEKAITRLQIFNFDPRFMNNGELLFYKGLLEFIKLDNEKESEALSSANYNSFLLNFNKCIGLIKNEEVNYMDWILNFLHKNCLVIMCFKITLFLLLILILIIFILFDYIKIGLILVL